MFFALAVLLVATTTTTFVYSSKNNKSLSYIIQNNIETLSSDDVIDNPICWSGGQGAISCAIGGGISISGVGVRLIVRLNALEDIMYVAG